MANYIPNKNLTESQKLCLQEGIDKIGLELSVGIFLREIRIKYNIDSQEEFDCSHMQNLDKAYKKLQETKQKRLSLIPANDW